MKKQLEACVLFIKNEIKTGRIYLMLMALSFLGLVVRGYYLPKNNNGIEKTFDEQQKDKEIEEKNIKAYVIVSAQNKVEDCLKSPSTADFPWAIEPVKINDTTYTVISYVDAQNEFGATIRANYMIEVTIDRKTKNTKAKLILFEERK